MITVISIVLIIAALFMSVTVLLQSSEEGGISAISGKNRILRVIEGQDEYIRRFSAMAIKQEDRRGEARAEHHRLVDLVEQKNLPEFEKLMKHHIDRSKECCLAALAARKQNRDL